VFGYNSAESEPIWIKLGAQYIDGGVGLADFGCNLRSTNGLRGRRNFVFFSPLNNADFTNFPSNFTKFKHNNVDRVAMKTFGT